jgi:hypothetical protein
MVSRMPFPKRPLKNLGTAPLKVKRFHFALCVGNVQGPVVGNRLRQRRMAHPCQTHEDGRAAYRAVVGPSRRGPARA